MATTSAPREQNSQEAMDVQPSSSSAETVNNKPVEQVPNLPLTDCGNKVTIEELILEKIKPADQIRSTRRRIDVAEMITTVDYAEEIKKRKLMTKKVKKEKLEKENESAKEPKKRGRKPKK